MAINTFFVGKSSDSETLANAFESVCADLRVRRSARHSRRDGRQESYRTRGRPAGSGGNTSGRDRSARGRRAPRVAQPAALKGPSDRAASGGGSYQKIFRVWNRYAVAASSLVDISSGRRTPFAVRPFSTRKSFLTLRPGLAFLWSSPKDLLCRTTQPWPSASVTLERGQGCQWLRRWIRRRPMRIGQDE